jgi:putative lipoprotein
MRAPRLARKRASRILLLPLLPALAGAVLAGPAFAGAMADCMVDGAADEAVTRCLESTELEVAAELERVRTAAAAHFTTLDAITGNQRASRTLAQSQVAYELFRDLDCHLDELNQGVSAKAADHRLACRIDHDRARIGTLAARLPAGAMPAAAPSGDSEMATGTSAMIFGTSWRAVEIDGTPVADGVEITLMVDQAGGLTGRSGCNRYFGQAEIDGVRIGIGGLGTTRMACPEPMMAEEQRYLAAVESVAGWRIEGEALLLSDEEGTVRLRLARSLG